MDTETDPYTCCDMRFTSDLKIHRLKRGMEKGIPCKWNARESQNSNTYIRQNGFKNIDCNKRHRKILHNDQGINLGRYNICKYIFAQHQFSSFQSISRVWLFVTPWIAARQASLSITNSRSSLRLTSIESVMPSSHLILCHPFLLLPPIPHRSTQTYKAHVNGHKRRNQQ